MLFVLLETAETELMVMDRANSVNSDDSHIKKKSKSSSSTSSLGSSVVVLSELGECQDDVSAGQSYQLESDDDSVTTSRYDIEAWINTQAVRHRVISSPASHAPSLINVPSCAQDEQSVMGVSTLSLIVERLVVKIMDLEDSNGELKNCVNEISDENKGLMEKVAVLEVDRDDQLQWNISNRILIFNVPTKLRVSELKQLMVGLARRINIALTARHINDAYYLYKHPSTSSPVVIVFINNALEKRYQILDRKHLLQNIKMRALGFTQHGNKVGIDELLIKSRNEFKQEARRLKRQGLVQDSWVRDGNVWVRDVCGDVKKIVSQACLESYW